MLGWARASFVFLSTIVKMSHHKESSQIVSTSGGQFRTSGFRLILQEVSTESDQFTGDTFSLFFHLWKQRKCLENGFFPVGLASNTDSWNHNYLMRVHWGGQKRTKWLKQELLWLPQPIDSVYCVWCLPQLKIFYCLGDRGSPWSDFQIMLVTS